MNELSITEIESLRALVLQNSEELVVEAEVLFSHQKFARAYALAHLSSEELAKLPILALAGIALVKGASINWKMLDERLRSHSAKLKGLLFVDLLGTSVDPTTKEIKVHQETISMVELFNALKNVSLYAGVYQGDLYKPNAVITQSLAEQMLTKAKNRFALSSEIERVTHGRISELANRQSYMDLLKALGIGDYGWLMQIPKHAKEP